MNIDEEGKYNIIGETECQIKLANSCSFTFLKFVFYIVQNSNYKLIKELALYYALLECVTGRDGFIVY